jgi:hypothetical protein
MAQETSSRKNGALRWCGACCLSFARWAVWLALGISLAVLSYVAAVREVTVPGFLLRRAESQLARYGLQVRLDRAMLSPRGHVQADNVRLFAAPHAEPLFTARSALLHLDFWSLVAGGLTVHEIRVEGASLGLPAMASPTGAGENLVSDLSATLRRTEEHWRIDQLVFRLGALGVTAQGEVWRPSAAGLQPEFTGLVGEFLRRGRAARVQMQGLDSCERPALAVRIAARPDHTHRLDLVFTADAVRAAGVTARQVAATTTVFPAARPVRVHLHASARDLGYGGEWRAARAHAQVQAALADFSSAPRAEEALLALSGVENEFEYGDAPVLRADLRAWPVLRAEAAFAVRRETLIAEVEADLRAKAATVRLAGLVLPDLANGHMAKHLPRTSQWLQIRSPGRVDVTARFGEGWKFRDLDARIAAGALDFRGVGIDSAHGRLAFDGRELLATDSVLRLGDNFARGSYWQDVRSRDYRMLLTGRMRPLAIAPWFRADGWWPRLWADFDFTAAAPAANVDVQGRWNDGARATFFGGARVARPAVRGVGFDQVEAVVFARGGFTRGEWVDGARAGGAQFVRGAFDVWRGRPERKDSIGFDLDLRLDPAAHVGLLGKPAENFLRDWWFASPPRIAARGRLGSGAYAGDTSYTFQAALPDRLRYRHFPLDGASAAGGVTGADFRVDQIEFSLGGGRGAGKISLGGPEGARQLGFDLYLKDAELTRVILAAEEYARQGAPGSSDLAGSKFMQRAAGGKIEVALSAIGDPGELASFKGSGNAIVTGAELGEIHLFGLLSQVLSGLSLNFSSLKLDQARSGLRLADGVVTFPDLRISGPAALIEGRGTYALAGGGLDFTAKFTPYDRTKTLLQDALGLLLNPLTSIIELRLGGQLKDPKWSYSLGESKPREPVPTPAPATQSQSRK